MKKYLNTFALLSFIVISCTVKKTSKSQPAKVETSKNNASTDVVIADKTLGKVSHKYRSSGCNTVIEIQREGEEVQTLIPKDQLPASLDKDGSEIYFNYTLLRMPQPAGCTIGQPAEITDAIKK